MYQSYFGLAEAPFSIAPDPRYLYMSERHQEALAHLLYGVNGGGGFVLLTGEVGAGKTTICRCLLEQIPAACDVAYIFNPRQTVAELLSTICAEFGIAYPSGNTSLKVYIDCINAYLLDAHAKGRHTVLIIDEAQNLSADVLEQMRLLTNLETSQRKLLQIILLGQSELAVMLERPELRQLAQRIIARYHLGPLARHEVAAYVRHRLAVAGTQRQLFPDALMGRLHRLSGGIPRVINVLCDRALLGAYVQGKERVDRSTLMQASREVLHQPAARAVSLRPILLASLLASVVLAVAVYQPSQSASPPNMPPVNIEPVKPVLASPDNTTSPLWRPAAVTNRKIRLGDHGPDVEWLGKQLEQIYGKRAEPANPLLFDESMRRQVKQFQTDQGLVPDGTVGEQTMMRLNSTANAIAPKPANWQTGK